MGGIKYGSDDSYLDEIDVIKVRNILNMIKLDCPIEYELTGGFDNCEGKRCIDC